VSTLDAAFAIVWIGGGFAALIYLSRIKDPKRKQTAFVWITASAGVIFTLFVLISAPPDPPMLIFIPFVALIILLNIRLTKFCPRCAAWNYNWTWIMPMRYCRRCGADLETGERQPQGDS
jgi:hypothetical protein